MVSHVRERRVAGGGEGGRLRSASQLPTGTGRSPSAIENFCDTTYAHTVLSRTTKFSMVIPGSILSVESNHNVESKTKNVESKIAFGQLILRKIIKTVATRF